MRLDDIFIVKNGLASSEVNVMPHKIDGAIPYIRPSSTQNRTIAGWIDSAQVNIKNINQSETLFVSTDGEGSHTYAYVSKFEFVANSNVSVLIPKKSMTLNEKLFYAKCITMNRYRFSYGRKPKGDRLKSIELPDSIPLWVYEFNAVNIDNSLISEFTTLSSSEIKRSSFPLGMDNVKVSDIFDVIYGSNLEMNRMNKDDDGINFVSRTSKNNGVTAKVALIQDIVPMEGGVLSVAGGGSVLETFVQLKPFYSGRDLFVLRPKVTMNTEELQFYATCIRANKSRYSYGRQANRTLKDLTIPSINSIPSWVYGSINNISNELLEK